MCVNFTSTTCHIETPCDNDHYQTWSHYNIHCPRSSLMYMLTWHTPIIANKWVLRNEIKAFFAYQCMDIRGFHMPCHHNKKTHYRVTSYCQQTTIPLQEISTVDVKVGKEYIVKCSPQRHCANMSSVIPVRKLRRLIIVNSLTLRGIPPSACSGTLLENPLRTAESFYPMGTFFYQSLGHWAFSASALGRGR